MRQSRRAQRQLERAAFPSKPAARRRKARKARKPLEAPTGIPGNCWACGNCCEPVGEPWTCPHCHVTYPPVSE